MLLNQCICHVFHFKEKTFCIVVLKFSFRCLCEECGYMVDQTVCQATEDYCLIYWQEEDVDIEKT